MSDRCDKESQEVFNFKDTTALRKKTQRTIVKSDFFQKSKNSIYQRPSCPPPLCPLPTQVHDAPLRPPRQQSNMTKTMTLLYFFYYNRIKMFITGKNGNKLLPTNEHEIRAARIFGLLPVSTINRSTVNKNNIKIKPLSRPTSPSLHEENDISNSLFQKTCIKINSDSSSTVHVKVNDSVKLYHSSVLINSDTLQLDNISQSKAIECLSSGKITLDQDIEVRTDNHRSKNTKTAIPILYKNTNGDNSDQDHTNFAAKESTKTQISLNNFNSEFNTLPANKKTKNETINNTSNQSLTHRLFIDSFILKVLSDPCLSHLLHGLEVKAIANIIENSLARIPINKLDLDDEGTKRSENDELLLKQMHDIIKQERYRIDSSISQQTSTAKAFPEKSTYCNLNFSSKDSDKIVSNKSEMIPIRKICEMLAECSFHKKDEPVISLQNDHQYESICLNCDPIYEEINEDPPPLPTNPPPLKNEYPDKSYKSMFLGATKYDILSYLVDAKDRIDPEEQTLSYTYKFLQRSVEETAKENITGKNGKIIGTQDKNKTQDKCTAIERNDSGVGSETSRSSRIKYYPGAIENDIPPIHLCEDCGKDIYFISYLFLLFIYLYSDCVFRTES